MAIAARWRLADHLHHLLAIRPMLQINHAAQLEPDCRDAVDRALDSIIEHPGPTKTDRLVPSTGKAFGTFSPFQIIGRDARHAHSVRSGINGADRRKRDQKLPLSLGCPAIMPITGEKNGGEFGLIV